MAKNDPIKPKGKGKKALNRLNAVNDEIDSIKDCLRNARNTLNMIIDKAGEFEKIDDMQSTTIETDYKKRSMLKDISERIKFEFGNLVFYIDFTVISSNSDDQTDIKGSIIYGTYRSLCFSDCIFPDKNDITNKICNKTKTENFKNCGKITRCDGLEDKPLLQFTVNRNGLIKSGSELDDKWWIKEKEDLLDLHIRALDFIWEKGLEWTNENLLP